MSTTTTTTDRIEKQIFLRASRERVWRALTDSREFGSWFGMRFAEPFKPGATIRATIVPTTVDPETAAMQKQFEGFAFDIVIERIEPQRLFSFRWHPGAVDPNIDYTKEPMTLVEFELKAAEGGILLTVAESGFDKIPLARRAAAFTGNEEGWTKVVTLIEKYLEQNA
ncbi:MAG TPA: SRPBCC family protein [Gemmatimonadaceae bacterium]|nr:SRPBCC family protein [Gemmatimonadaceae bacterium]